MTIRLRSRIHTFFNAAIMKEMDRVCMDKTIGDNNAKTEIMLSVLNQFDLEYVELGQGTNRLAILIDNYVFKIALDFQGKRDNMNEFKLSQELQPYVCKTYENNDLISVHEYVTLISREDYERRRNEIKKILAILAESFLLGDVGVVPKNFCNWGTRDDDSLVCLDFAHIYRVNLDQIVCRFDRTILEYDENFHNMKCPACNHSYRFMDVRRLIPYEDEFHENEITRALSYKLRKPIEVIEEQQPNGNDINGQVTKPKRPSRYKFIGRTEEEIDMGKKDKWEDDYVYGGTDDDLDEAAALLASSRNEVTEETVKTTETVVHDGEKTIVKTEEEILKTEHGQTSSLRVYREAVTEPVDRDEAAERAIAIQEQEEQDREIEEAKELTRRIAELESAQQDTNQSIIYTPTDIAPSDAVASILSEAMSSSMDELMNAADQDMSQSVIYDDQWKNDQQYDVVEEIMFRAGIAASSDKVPFVFGNMDALTQSGVASEVDWRFIVGESVFNLDVSYSFGTMQVNDDQIIVLASADITTDDIIIYNVDKESDLNVIAFKHGEIEVSIDINTLFDEAAKLTPSSESTDNNTGPVESDNEPVMQTTVTERVERDGVVEHEETQISFQESDGHFEGDNTYVGRNDDADDEEFQRMREEADRESRMSSGNNKEWR